MPGLKLELETTRHASSSFFRSSKLIQFLTPSKFHVLPSPQVGRHEIGKKHRKAVHRQQASNREKARRRRARQDGLFGGAQPSAQKRPS